MKINLITPANKYTKRQSYFYCSMGKIVKSYGHNTQINTECDGSACDIMIALHARHSAEAINRYKAKYPKGL